MEIKVNQNGTEITATINLMPDESELLLKNRRLLSNFKYTVQGYFDKGLSHARTPKTGLYNECPLCGGRKCKNSKVCEKCFQTKEYQDSINVDRRECEQQQMVDEQEKRKFMEEFMKLTEDADEWAKNHDPLKKPSQNNVGVSARKS
jgi:hypothetical protein